MSAQMSAPGTEPVVMGFESMLKCVTMETLMMTTGAVKTVTLLTQTTSSAGRKLTSTKAIDLVI